MQFINFPIELKELNDNEEENEYIWNIINNQKPIWCRDMGEVQDEEYNEFYKTISNDYNIPLAKCHFKAEGQIEFNCLLYIPEKSPYDLFESKDKSKNIKLFVKRIFIMDDCDELCPEWLRFMKGIVDSKDVPLNVSRELLQQNRVLKQINKIITKKCLELFADLSFNEDQYNKFYDNYCKMLKLGVHEDNRNRDKILKLLRFYSVNSETNYISLDEYINNMNNDQNKIYYITGQNKSSLISSPFIEKLKENGYDVLLFTDPIDEYWVQSVRDYRDKKMVDVSKEGIHFDSNDIKRKEKEYDELIIFLKEELGDKIQSVKVSDRLNNAPCVLVVSEYGWSANMERIVRAQALRNEEMDKMIGTQRILEINLDHKIMRTLAKKIKIKKNLNQCKNILNIVFNTAMINSGFTLDKPNDYANEINKIIEVGFCK
jgi:molecular chaperone HtpG